MLKTGEEKRNKKLPRWAGWVIGYVGVLAGSAALAYFWRIAFEQGVIPMLPFAGIIACVASILYLFLFLICRFCKEKLCLKAALCVFVLGLLFCFATPPMQVPDEASHYLRANAISRGRFDYNYQRVYDNETDLLIQTFPMGYNHKVKYGGWPLATNAFVSYEKSLQEGRQAEQVQNEPIMFMLLPYLPQAGGMALARLFGFGALGLMYAGRLANLLVYTLLAYVVFKNCDKYRGVFFALALLPLSLFMATSCSYDSIMLVLCYLAVSYFCKNEIHSRDVVAFGLAVAFITYLKPMNIVLAAILLLIPKPRWKSRWKPWLVTGIVVVAALALWYGIGFIDGGLLAHNYPPSLPRGSTGKASPQGQMDFIVNNPFAFLARAGLTLYEEAGFLFNLGSFGSLDLFIPLVSGLSVLGLAVAAALGIQQKDDTKTSGAVALFLAAGLYTASVLLGIYVADSDVGSIRITGLQPRYFLPVFLLLCMLASILLGKAVRPQLSSAGQLARTQSITLWVVAALALVAAVLLIQNNFIGQWLAPSGENGYKLVNLIGVFTMTG